jgi:uncharacterized protein (DUF983 family)
MTPRDYQQAALAIVITVIGLVVLFFIAKSILSFLIEHWVLTVLGVVAVVVVGALLAARKGG